ncbi:hypothetical protein C8F01DRAFT_1232236 [Mycena amicta]|nr:hypothetical protein C8F01DRAFT_1232236 [Mycena amicta]
MNLEDPQSLVEFLEGLGADRFTDIIVSFFQLVSDGKAGEDEMLWLGTIRCFARTLQRINLVHLDNQGRTGSNRFAPLRQLYEALLQRGILSALINLLLYMSQDDHATPTAFRVNVCRQCLTLLVRIVAGSIGTPQVDQTLEIGLLDAIIQASANGHLGNLDDFKVFFTGLLPMAVVYRHTVVIIRAAIARIRLNLESPSVRQSQSFSMVSDFISLAHPYIGVLDQLEGSPSMPQRVCDNLTCSQVASRTAFKRCGTCQAAYYCTKACQKADWKAGHRDICSPSVDSESPAYLGSSFPAVLAFHDRLYLRAVLQHFYEEKFTDIIKEQVSLLIIADEPLVAPIAVVFDWTDATAGLPTTRVRNPLEEDFMQLLCSTDGHARWHAIVRRAQNSGGRIGLHLAIFAHKLLSLEVLVPLRLSSASVDGAVRELAVRVKSQRETQTEEERDEMIAVKTKEIRDRWWNERGIH